MNNFLLEILTQEMPYAFIPSAISQMKSAFDKLFCEYRISFDKIDVFATPRRLAVIVKGLQDKQKSSIKELRGPVLQIAKDANGNYTPAAFGFAKKNNLNIQDLIEKEGYIWATINEGGASVKDILSENLEKIILNLQGAHFMRWGSSDVKFSRPIENIVAMLNEEILDVEIVNKKATNKTRGLRYSDKEEIIIDNPLTYVEQLKNAHVIVNQDERKKQIEELAKDVAEKIDAEVEIKPELLEEVTYLTEYPNPILCSFDKHFLSMPDIVNTTVMSKHQRYFPLYKNNKLLNNFITMANFDRYDDKSIKNIQEGNQRVVTARLQDGVFFYEEDTKTPLVSKVEDLKGMTFQRNLGSLFDKTQRIIKLADFISDKLKFEKEDILRCALLCKADLSCKLVFEFTELQGFIGEDYALKSGEKENVAKGIAQHYYPLSATADIASTKEGITVGIADKIDTISSVFLTTQGDKKKKRPTGSNDPLGIRRAILGIFRTVIARGLNLNLSELIDKSFEIISQEFSIKVDPNTKEELENFFITRLSVMCEKEHKQSILKSVAGALNSPLENLQNYFERVSILEKMMISDNFGKILENAQRVSRIIPKDKKEFKQIDEKLFVEKEEQELYQTLQKTSSYEQFEVLANHIEKFFDKVLVMDKDEKIKENRISLLNLAKDKFKTLCDFSLIEKGL